jgi:hypothetical protein
MTTGGGTPRGCTHRGDCAGNLVCVQQVCATPPAPDTTCAGAVRTPTAPVIFFTDIESGPITGGENNLGVFITIYGLRFGDDASDALVSIGGTEVAKYVSWNPPADQGSGASDPARLLPRGLQRIVVQPGPSVSSGDIEVVVAGQPSNPLPFTVRAGRILWVDGSAASEGNGSLATPFKYLYDLKGSNVTAGDTVYVKNGGAGFVYTDQDPSAGLTHTHLSLSSGDPTGGANAPIAIIGYPDTPPVIGGQPGGARVDAAFAFQSSSDYYSDANFDFTNFDILFTAPRLGFRFVGNKIDGSKGDTSSPTIETADATQSLTVFGNYFANQIATSIGWYFFPRSVAGLNLGWNEFVGGNGSLGVNALGSLSNSVFHDNFADTQVDVDNSNVALIGVSLAGISFYNNVFLHAGTGVFEIKNATGVAGAVRIHNNTLANLTTAPIATSILVEGTTNTAQLIALQDNIFCGSGNSFFSATALNVFSADHDFYDSFNGNTAVPIAAEPGAKIGNPLYVARATPDFSLTPLSPAINSGVSTGVCGDYLGVTRPRDTAYDVGAFEFVAPP